MSEPTVIIIGAGITGIGAAWHLRAHDIAYVILEGTDDVGGVWNTQRWHGARCDSEFVKYSYSFKPFLSSQRHQGREAIQRYLASVAREFSILPQIRFGTRVSRAVFDPDAARWVVHTNRGTFTARFLINGNGYVGQPHVPAFADAVKFRGEIVHTSALDDRRTFADQDVVLVGSGSTAICCAPALSRVSRSLVLLQRSPSYIADVTDAAGPLTRLCQTLYRMGIGLPLKALRYYLQAKDDLIFVGCRRAPRLARWFFRRHWVGAVGQASVDAHFTPRYDPWEQRICVAIGLQDALRRGDVAIRTGEIDYFTESAIVLTTGEHLPCDVVVLATGFDVDFLKFDLYVGDQQVSAGGTNLYKGVMMGGVPNYFHPVGVWHSAWTQRSETASRFAIRIMTYMQAHGYRTVSVERRQIDAPPGITPNYITRNLAKIPKLHGTWDLPSVDNVVSYRFDPRRFTFG